MTNDTSHILKTYTDMFLPFGIEFPPPSEGKGGILYGGPGVKNRGLGL